MEIIITSILAFASTNIDDIFILSLFFGDKRYKTKDIYLGQYLGIILLICLSLAGSLLGNFINAQYIGLLGLFPIYLGIRQLISLIQNSNKEKESEPTNINASKAGILSVAALTVANGGDNIGVYVPLFTALTVMDTFVMVSIFILMVLIWLSIAKYLATHPILATAIAKYGHILTPVALCLLGLFILKENGSFDLIKNL